MTQHMQEWVVLLQYRGGGLWKWNYMKDIMPGKFYIDVDMVQDTEKMTEIMLDYFEFDKSFKCSGKFDDGTTCECGSCNE